MGVSRSECFRCFKKFTNKKPMEYINEYRLFQASKLLKLTPLSIEEITKKCGFSTSSYFGKQFKEVYGVTPLHYRKNNKLKTYF
ncbi:MAG TPA: helix-turn-helix transcriptional regulator [Enterococcus sp.]|nr:helix-turn-helix transcriptional regulator [Enterococcus sp.]